jgi:hypothetical protein
MGITGAIISPAFLVIKIIPDKNTGVVNGIQKY